MKKSLLSFGIGCGCLLALSASAAPNAAMIAKVKSGELKEARASWWGFNDDDATACLQAAIDSKVPKLIIDLPGKSWNVDPIRLVSNQEIVMEAGVQIVAKRNSFLDTSACLFTLTGLENVKIRGNGAHVRMYRDDYVNPPYNAALVGNRHAFRIRGCTHVSIDNITVSQSGGSGILLEAHPVTKPCSGIRITNCRIDKSCSHGIHVRAAVKSSFENVSVSETDGYWPRTGVSLESSNSQHPLQDLVFKNVSARNCAGYGFEIAVYGDRDAKASEVTADFQNCVVDACDIGIYYIGNSTNRKYPRGKLSFTDCTVARTRRHAVKITQKPREGIALEFNGGLFDHCCVKYPTYDDIDLDVGTNDDLPIDGIKFNELEIRQGDAKRDWIHVVKGNWMADDIRAIDGKVFLATKAAKRRFVLNNAWRKSMFPPKSKGATLPREMFTPDPKTLEFTDLAKGAAVPLSPLKLKGTARYIFHAPAGVVRFGVRYLPSTNKRRNTRPILIRPFGKDEVTAKLDLPDFSMPGGPGSALSFTVPKEGFYTMEANVGQNGFMLSSSTVPVAVDVSAKPFLAYESGFTLYLVPSRGKTFAVFSCGTCFVDILQPNGVSAWSGEQYRDWSRYLCKSQHSKTPWRITVDRSPTSGFGTCEIDVKGVPGHLFLSDRKFWRVP